VLRLLVFLSCAVMLLGSAWAQTADETADAAHARFRALLEINEPARATMAEVVERASSVLRAANPEERRSRADEFAVAADNARAAISTALRELAALSPFPDTPSDPSAAQLVRSHQSGAEQGLRALLDLVDRLERVVANYVAGDENAAVDEGVALVDASLLLTKQAANESRLRARLTPHLPWVEPMDNAAAELIDGMASMIELRGAGPDRQAQVREAIQLNADRLRAYLSEAETALEVEPRDAEAAATLRELMPRIRERVNWLNQAAVELEAGGRASDVNEQRERLQAVRALFRQITTSQESALRDTLNKSEDSRSGRSSPP